MSPRTSEHSPSFTPTSASTHLKSDKNCEWTFLCQHQNVNWSRSTIVTQIFIQIIYPTCDIEARLLKVIIKFWRQHFCLIAMGPTLHHSQRDCLQKLFDTGTADFDLCSFVSCSLGSDWMWFVTHVKTLLLMMLRRCWRMLKLMIMMKCWQIAFCLISSSTLQNLGACIQWLNLPPNNNVFLMF